MLLIMVLLVAWSQGVACMLVPLSGGRGKSPSAVSSAKLMASQARAAAGAASSSVEFHSKARLI